MTEPKAPSNWAHIPIWVRVALAVFALNVASFYVIGTFLGGDAARGYYLNGKYYLSDGHRMTEVSSAVYHYSTIHFIFVLVTLSIVAIGIKKSARRPGMLNPFAD